MRTRASTKSAPPSTVSVTKPMTAWKLAQALQQNFADCNEAAPAPVYVIRSSSTPSVGPEGIFNAVFPLGKRTPVQRVAELSAATRLARRILAEVESRLEAELAKTRGAFEGLRRPNSSLAQPVYELTCQGLEEHWGALELVDAVLAGDDDELLAQAVQLAEHADRTLDQAEQAASQLRRAVPLEA